MKIKKSITQLLKLSFLAVSLPLLISYPSFSRECTEADTQANLAKLPDLVDKLEDLKHQKYAFLLVATQCNTGAVESLISIVQNKAIAAEIRHHAALTLAYKADFGVMSMLFRTTISQDDQSKIIKALMTVLTDQQDDPEVRYGVVRALGYLDENHKLGADSPEVIKALIAIVKDRHDNTKIRSYAPDLLYRLYQDEGSSEVIQTLTTIVADTQDSSEVRIRAAEVLSPIVYSAQNLTILEDSPQDYSASLIRAAETLRRMREISPEVVKALSAVVENPQDNPELRLRATNILGRITETSPEMVKTLSAVVENSQDNPEIRLRATDILGRMHNSSPEVVKALSAVVENPQDTPELRMRAIDILEDMRDSSPEMVKALITVVENPQDTPELRMRATDILGRMQETSPEIVQALTTITTNQQENPEVRRRAARWLNPNQSPRLVVRSSVRILEPRTSLNPDAADETSQEEIQALITTVTDQQKSLEVRNKAAYALVGYGRSSPEAIQTLVTQALVNIVIDQQESVEFRSNIARILFEFIFSEFREALPEVIKEVIKNLAIIVKDPQDSPEVRSHAAHSLGRIREASPEVIQTLAAIVKDPQDSPKVRIDIADMLGGFHEASPDILQALIAIIKNQQDNLEVRSHAAQALDRIRKSYRSNKLSNKNELREWIQALKSVLVQPDVDQEMIVKDIKSEIERSENHLKSYEVKNHIYIMILGQRQYYAYTSPSIFSTKIQDLRFKIPEETQKYRYAILLQSGDSESVMMTAQAKLERLHSFTGAIFVHEFNNSMKTMTSIICMTDIPSTTPPKMPLPPTENRPPSCPPGSVKNYLN